MKKQMKKPILAKKKPAPKLGKKLEARKSKRISKVLR
jgi:hypothetical protein